MALSFDDKKEVRKALTSGLGRTPTQDEYRQALLHHPNTRQYEDLGNVDADTAAVDAAIKKDDLNNLTAQNANEQLLGLNKTPDNYVMKDIDQTPILDDTPAAPKEEPVQAPDDEMQDNEPSDKEEAAKEALSSVRSLPAAPTSPIPSVPKVSPLEDTEFDKAKAEALQNRKDAILSDVMSKIGTALANQNAVISKGVENPMEEINKAELANANSPLELLKAKRDEYKRLVENRNLSKSQDPNSAESIASRELYRSMGGKTDDNSSAADLDQSLKYLQQKYSVDEARKARQMQYQQNLEMRKALLESKVADKDKKSTEDYLGKVSGNVRGASQFQNLNSRMDGVGQALALIKAHQQNGKSFLRPSEMTELNMELARILTGSGVVHESTMKSIDPSTGPKALAQMMEKVTGQPYNINNLDAQIDRLTHNLGNQYNQAEKQAMTMAKALSNKDKKKLDAAQEYFNEKRAVNNMGDFAEGNKATSSSSKGTVSNSTLQDYASKHNISVDDARNLLTKSGYNVEN